jgi:hypothetical protein
MADGIEFLIDIRSKLDEANKASQAMNGVTEAAGKTDKAINGTEAEFQRLQKHLTALRRPGQIGQLRKEISALENPRPAQEVGILAKGLGALEGAALGLVAGLGVGVVLNGIGAMVSKVKELGIELLMTAGEAQRTERAMTLLLGENEAPEILGWIDEMARVTEFTDGPLKGLAINLTRAGFKGEDLSRALSAVTDMAAMSENKMEGAGAAAEMLSRIRLKGGIGDRDLLRLGIAPDAFYAKLGADLGVGAKKVEEQLQQGKIKAETIIEAVYRSISEKTGKPLGGAGLSMTSTFLSQLEKAKDIIPNLFEGLSQSGGLDSITAALGRLTSALSPDAPGGKAIIDGLERMLNAFADLINKVDIKAFADGAVKFFEVLTPLVELATKAIVGFAKGLSFLAENSTAMQALKAVRGAAGFFGIGQQVAEGFAQGIAAGSSSVTTATSAMFQGAENELKLAADIQSPSRVFMDLGTMTALGYTKGIANSEPDVREAVQRAFMPPAPAALQSDGYASPGGNSTSVGGDMYADITVNIGGVSGGSDASAQGTAAAVETGIMQALQRSFERWQDQMGAG